ncbi:hypothetical protein EW146_g193 [Bondarzewia mesenterica]|uniref:Cytosine deaminase n=1 Tax=Bondarzewia mesenterica TaxID=1095465 RepID=A0A4S4ME16_9AGAM|nr:hypothetical protein EW146_g193 [Bondarzewia mesenterica]
MSARILGEVDIRGLAIALQEARKGYDEGGVPIGCAILQTQTQTQDTQAEPKVLGAGHNLRVQKASATLHAEISALETAGRLKASVYKTCTLYTTLSPCIMCTGAILLYGIPRVVIGENANFVGGEDLLRSHGVEVIVVNDAHCTALMAKFIQEKPELWYEDIGEVHGTNYA